MKKAFVYFFIIIFVSGLLFFYPFQASAKTMVAEQNSCNYKIKVNIVFDFKYDISQPEAERILTDWYVAMNTVWNGANGSVSLANSCSAQYEFFLIKMHNANKVCADYPDFHCITVVDDIRNSRGNLADVSISQPNSGQNSLGEWSRYIDPLVAAHEVGHMMGLEDEYSYQVVNGVKKWQNHNYKQVGPQSIMAKTWGNVAAFEEHTTEILKLAGITI